jgi:2-methylisocitrate lyase-like PEP mutase family enzyme
VAETLHRAALYTQAGADGLFVPALVNPDDIRAVVAGIQLPLNVLAWNGLAPSAELGRLGVSRLSAGSGISQVLWKHAEDLAKAFLAGGKSETLAGQMPYGQLQNLF